MSTNAIRSRWAAIGAAVAVTLGGGGLVMVDAAQDTGERSVYNSIVSCRLIDTRPNKGIGGRTAPLGPNEIFVVDTHGDSGECTGTPTDITAVQLNITPVLPTEATDLTIWPDGDPPNASSLNPAPGQPPTPNAVTTEVTSDGEFRIRNKFGNVHVPIGKASFSSDQLLANLRAIVGELERVKPASAKGRYLKKVAVSPTQGPSVRIDPARIEGVS